MTLVPALTLAKRDITLSFLVKFSWNWNLDCCNSQSFINPKRRDTFRSRNAQIITLFKMKFFHGISILSVEFSSPQSHGNLLCSFLGCTTVSYVFPALPSPPRSFFALTPKTSSSFLQPYISGYNHRRVWSCAKRINVRTLSLVLPLTLAAAWPQKGFCLLHS